MISANLKAREVAHQEAVSKGPMHLAHTEDTYNPISLSHHIGAKAFSSQELY